jgi:hypothetical protein
MTLYEKIITIYPDLTSEDFGIDKIYLRNDSDGRGDYIFSWNNPTHPQPTQEQLDAVSSTA